MAVAGQYSIQIVRPLPLPGESYLAACNGPTSVSVEGGEESHMPRNLSFPETRWTRIVHAAGPDQVRARVALEELLRLYWYPIYGFIRSSGHSHHEAEDLTQEFFAYATAHNTLQRADRRKGRFRTFLLACVQNFLTDAYRAKSAQKRGGRIVFIEFDGLTAEARYAVEPGDNDTPERVFERLFARELLEDALKQLEAEATQDGDAAVFAGIRGYLTGDGTGESYQVLSTRLQIKPQTLRSKTGRYRDRLRQLVDDRVKDIVDNDEDVKAEKIALESAL
jgi:RNA polymerase sigma factor (sigma-70 family)